MHHFRSLLAMAIVWLATLTAQAQPADDARATAVALFDEARELMAAEQHEAACPKLAEAQRLAPGIGILFNLSLCYQQTGRSASAWAGFRQVASQAKSAGQTEREQDARSRLAALEPKLTRIVVVVTQPVDGLRIVRDGIPVRPAQWGGEFPVDPGTLQFRAQAPGRKSWRSAVEVRGEGTVVRVVVPALPEADGVDAQPEPQPIDTGQVTDITAPAFDDSAGNRWQVPLGIATLSTGAVAIGVAGAMAIAAKVKADAADCDAANTCSDEGLDDRDEAVTLGNVATGVVIAGGVLAAVGLTLWLTAPADAAPAGAGSADVGIELSPEHVHLKLRF